MRAEEFEEKKRIWLRQHFADVSTQPEGSGVIARVPLLFKSTYYEPHDRSPLTRFHTGRDRFVLTPVEAKGGSVEDSLSALFEEIVMNPENWALVGQGLDLYIPKPGQNPDEVIKVGEPMVVVRHDDPEHRHGSPRLIDFAAIEIVPLRSGPLVMKGSLDDNHSHFLIK